MRKTDIKFFKSLKWKMSSSVIIAAAIIIVAVIAVAMPTAEGHIGDITEAYILDLAVSKGETIERAIEHSGDAESVYKSEAGEILKNVKVKDMPSSYAYLVNSDGTMVFHPTADKIGQPVENSVVNLTRLKSRASGSPAKGYV